jgi:hypothetical protein
MRREERPIHRERETEEPQREKRESPDTSFLSSSS